MDEDVSSVLERHRGIVERLKRSRRNRATWSPVVKPTVNPGLPGPTMGMNNFRARLRRRKFGFGRSASAASAGWEFEAFNSSLFASSSKLNEDVVDEGKNGLRCFASTEELWGGFSGHGGSDPLISSRRPPSGSIEKLSSLFFFNGV